jgi:hypothetical protein
MRVQLIAAAFAGASFAGVLHAEEVGAPVSYMPKGSFGVGLEYGSEQFGLRRAEGFGIPEFQYDVKMKVTSLKASYALADGIAITLRGGKLSDGETVGANSNGATNINGTGAEGDLLGLGLDAVLWQKGAFAVGLNARYTEYSWEGNQTRVGGSTSTGRDTVELSSAQAGLGAGYTFFDSLTAYGGVRYQRLSGSTLYVRSNGNQRNRADLKEDDPWGGYLGVRYKSPWKFSVGAEIQAADSWNVNVGFQF